MAQNKQPINQLFKQHVVQDSGWIKDWKKDCFDFVSDVAILRDNILANPQLSIDSPSLYENLENKAIQSYEDFMRKWLKEFKNGIASRGQSVLSEIDFQTIIEDDDFKEIAKQVISAPSLDNYNMFTNWWYSNNDISNRPLLINRAMAACNPSQISTTAHGAKFWVVFNRLQADYGFTFTENHNWNWYLANQQLTNWLDKQLSTELNSISSNILEQQIWRNIFIWVLYEEREVIKNIKPNTLKRVEKPDGNYTEIPKSTKTFEEVDIDFQSQAKEQKDLGDAGEELVKQFEIDFLKSKGLNEKISDVKIMKNGVGFDILSYDESGNEKYIEVKTTTGDKYTPFYLSENEFEFMTLHKGSYSIYRVFNFNVEYHSGEFFEIKDEVENQIFMKPIEYRVFLKKE